MTHVIIQNGIRMEPLELQSEVFGNVGASFSLVGQTFGEAINLLDISSTLNQPVIISLDGVTDHLVVGAGGFKIYDFTSNDGNISAQYGVYVKSSGVLPTSGSIYVSAFYRIN